MTHPARGTSFLLRRSAFGCRGLAVASVGTLLLAGCGGGAADGGEGNDGAGGDAVEPVTLQLVAAWPENDKYQNTGLTMYREQVTELCEGSVTIEFAGGPESIAPFDLADSVREGAVDMAWISAAYYLPQLPEAAVFDYSQKTIEEERASGAWEYINDIHHEKMNVHVIGRGSVGTGYSIYTTQPVDSVDDFEGMRIRVSPVYQPFITALGAETVTLPGGEIFTSVERGVIDGFTWPYVGISAMQLHEVTGYQVTPIYWQNDIVELINLDVWEGLAESQQECMTEAAIALEGMTSELYEELRAEELAVLEEAGVEQIEFEGAEAEEFLELSRSSAEQWLRENVSDADPLIEQFLEQ